MLPPKQKGEPRTKRPQNELGVWGILRLLLKSIKEDGSFGSYSNPYRLARSSCQETIGREGSSAFTNGMVLKTC